MLFVRKNFMVWRRLLRTLAAFFRLRTMLGFSKKRRRRTSLKMRSPCTTLLNRFKADSNDSLSSTTTRVKKLTPLWFVICEQHYNRRREGCQTACRADFPGSRCDGKINPMKKPAIPIDYSLYAGRWIAIVRDRVAGVGRTPDEARRAAKVSRPKDDPQVVYVPRNYRKGDKLIG
jgi:hypothetical protein